MVFRKSYTESALVDTHCRSNWIKYLPGILADIFSNDIFNVDKTLICLNVYAF